MLRVHSGAANPAGGDYPMKMSIALAAAIAALSLAGTARADAEEVRIDIRHYDLTTDAGLQRLDRRIDAAAREVCTLYAPGSRAKHRVDADCYHAALGAAEIRLAALRGKASEAALAVAQTAVELPGSKIGGAGGGGADRSDRLRLAAAAGGGRDDRRHFGPDARGDPGAQAAELEAESGGAGAGREFGGGLALGIF
jgi:UrcA family protein